MSDSSELALLSKLARNPFKSLHTPPDPLRRSHDRFQNLHNSYRIAKIL